jgi:hypothetical protein
MKMEKEKNLIFFSFSSEDVKHEINPIAKSNEYGSVTGDDWKKLSEIQSILTFNKV